MAELIGSWLNRVFLWNEQEFLRLRDSLPGILFMPLIFIIPGAFLGFLGFKVKVALLEIGIAFVWYHLLRLFWRRAPFVVEVGAAAEAALSKDGLLRRATSGAADVGEKYLQLAGAILSSELVVGFIAIWVPAHQDPLMAILAFFSIGALVFYAIWQWTGKWWRKIVFTLALFTTAASLFAVFLPQTSEAIVEKVPNRDRCIAARVRGLDLPDECKSKTPGAHAGVATLTPPICAGEKEHKLNLNEQVTVPLRQDCTTGWINFPPNAYFKIRNPGKLEMILWSGERYALGTDDMTYLNPSEVKVSVFRLRGDGVADVYVEKKT